MNSIELIFERFLNFRFSFQLHWDAEGSQVKTVHISSLLEPVGVRNFNFVHNTGIVNKDNFTVSEVGACRAKICKCNDNICQLRLDFETFVLNGPNTGYFKQTCCSLDIY